MMKCSRQSTLICTVLVLVMLSVAECARPFCCKGARCRVISRSKCSKFLQNGYNCYDTCSSEASSAGTATATVTECHRIKRNGSCKDVRGRRCRRSKYQSGTCAEMEAASQATDTEEVPTEEAAPQEAAPEEATAAAVQEDPLVQDFEVDLGKPETVSQAEVVDGQDDESTVTTDPELEEEVIAESDNPDDPVNIRNAALRSHNKHRAKHGVPNLSWSNEIERNAQKWADKCVFKHGNSQERKGWGENIGLGYPDVGNMIDGMYTEINNYNYNNPGFAMDTGHFTQIVWKGTKRVGCALGRGCDNKFWVCQYDPAGNSGNYAENVPRPI